MTPIKKHYGKIKSTDRRCAVVFMQLPESPEKALIIDVEALSPRFEQIITEILNAPAGQEARNLADYMNTRQVPETGRTVLNEFHANGYLRTEPVSNVIMLPHPSSPIPLTEILKQLGTLPDSVVKQQEAELEQTNLIVQNMNVIKNEERVQLASNLLYEAELLQAEAARKREQAYQYAPEFRPQAKNVDAEKNTSEAAVTVATTADEAVVEAKKSGRGGDRRSKAVKSDTNAG